MVIPRRGYFNGLEVTLALVERAARAVFETGLVSLTCCETTLKFKFEYINVVNI